ncbi:MAG: transposase zinc-binding domain-containing protein [Syntrophomonadaceae bacterium]
MARSCHLGFARVKCADCQHEYLLPFSCKRLYFCPSTLRVPPVFAIAHQ